MFFINDLLPITVRFLVDHCLIKFAILLNCRMKLLFKISFRSTEKYIPINWNFFDPHSFYLRLSNNSICFYRFNFQAEDTNEVV